MYRLTCEQGVLDNQKPESSHNMGAQTHPMKNLIGDKISLYENILSMLGHYKTT